MLDKILKIQTEIDVSLFRCLSFCLSFPCRSFISSIIPHLYYHVISLACRKGKPQWIWSHRGQETVDFQERSKIKQSPINASRLRNGLASNVPQSLSARCIMAARHSDTCAHVLNIPALLRRCGLAVCLNNSGLRWWLLRSHVFYRKSCMTPCDVTDSVVLCWHALPSLRYFNGFSISHFKWRVC